MEYVVAELESGISEIFPMHQIGRIIMNDKNEIEDFWPREFDINGEYFFPYKDRALRQKNKIKKIYITENIEKELAGVCKKC